MSLDAAGWQTLLTSITVVATGAGTVIAQIYRENRNHRWEVEERIRVAKELADKVELERDVAAQSRQEIKLAVVEVGKKADAAYDVGNHVAEKFERVHQQIDTLVNGQLDKVQKVEVVNTPLSVTNGPEGVKS